MNVGSLFTGIGGFDLGLERAGMRTVWQVEKEPYRLSVLARHFPDAERFSDVRAVGVHNLASVDVICGGFPCQDISLLWKGAGLDGPRSGLWSEFARVIRELGPRWVIVENVPALTSRGLDRVLGDLAQSGYDAEWDCIPASALGAPHRRDRIWVVAYPRGQRRWQDPGSTHGDEGAHEGRATEDDYEPFSSGSQQLQTGRREESLADSNPSGWNGRTRDLGTRRREEPADGCKGRVANPDRQSQDGPSVAWDERDPWAVEPLVGRMAHGIPARMDRIRALGDALVPQIAEWIGRRILEYEVSAREPV